MNIPRLQALRDHLATLPPPRFNLAYWFDDLPSWGEDARVTPACSTCACIAGDALVLFDPDTPVHLSEVSGKARDLLGLTRLQTSNLFQPLRPNGFDVLEPYHLPRHRSADSITPHEASLVIDHLINTGEVDWRIP